MRVLEIVLNVLIMIYVILLGTSKRRVLWFHGLSMINIVVLICHGIWEGLRWQMTFAYLLVLLFLISTVISFLRKSEPAMKKLFLRIIQFFCILFLIINTLLSIAMPVFRFPNPTGEYPVSTRTMHFIDKSRLEIYTSAEDDMRGLMVTFWYPAEEGSYKEKPYLNHLNSFGSAVLNQIQLPGFLLNYLSNVKTNISVGAPVSNKEKKYPLLIFSHGMGMPTEFYTSILSEVASHGYIVAAIEHPYSTLTTVFPNEKIATYITKVETFSDEELIELEGVWVDDIKFVLDELESVNDGGDYGIIQSRIDNNHIGVFGHSFGGAAAYQVCYFDNRIKAGINMDGSIYSLAATKENQPFLMITTKEYAESIKQNAIIPTYSELKEQQKKELKKQGVSKEQYDNMINRVKASNQAFDRIMEYGGSHISLEDMEHNNFSDLPFLSPVLRMIHMVGKVEKEKGLELINRAIITFFDKNLKETNKISLSN